MEPIIPNPTPYPHVNAVIDRLRVGIRAALGERLVGLYLYGSLVTGDYDDDSSDVDLLAVTKTDITQSEFDALKQMQDALTAEQARWHDRIEIAYLSRHALQTFRTERSPIAIISPGEPFHVKDAGIDWLMNWYVVRTYGRTLWGPPPAAVIAPISRDEFVQAVKGHMHDWREWLDHIDTRPAQAYAILTMCRGLYTARHGEQVSKLRAAQWAAAELPEWSALILDALRWRKAWREDADPQQTLSQTHAFVRFMIETVLREPS